jgi:hypothetical protein
LIWANGSTSSPSTSWGEVAFSRKFGFLGEGVDVENAIRTIDDSQSYNGIVGQVPELNYFAQEESLCGSWFLR